MSDAQPIPTHLIDLQRAVYAAQARTRDAARNDPSKHADRVQEEAEAAVKLHQAHAAYRAETGVQVLWWELRKAALDQDEDSNT